MMHTLLIFPDEVHVHILSNLDLKGILDCSLACRRLYQIVKNSLLLQYRIAQLASNVIDTGKSSLNTRERLDVLYQFERNWTTLNFASTHKAIKQNSDTWELIRGVLAFGFGRARKPPSGLDFTEFPSNMRTTQGRTWRYDDLNINIRDFTMDPCQDLVVIIERPNTISQPFVKHFVHLFTMSTGLPHPDASRQKLEIVLRHEYHSFILQSTEDILVILCFNTRVRPYTEQDQLFVWNWKSGQLLLHRSTPSRTIRFGSFSFLPSKHFLVSSFEPIRGSTYTPRLDIYKISTENDGEMIDPSPILTFELPPIHGDARVLSMLTRSDPPEGKEPSGSNQVFTTATSACLIVIALRIKVISRPYCFRLFVHASTLLSIAATSPSGIVPWENWGPSHSRLIETTKEPSWVGYVYGTRYVSLLPEVIPWEVVGIHPSHLRLLDFNPTPLPGIVSAGEFSDSSTVRWVHEASLVSKAKSIFQNHVRTCLCYREITSNKTYRYDGVIIDEDVIIGLYPRKESGKLMQGLDFLCI